MGTYLLPQFWSQSFQTLTQASLWYPHTGLCFIRRLTLLARHGGLRKNRQFGLLYREQLFLSNLSPPTVLTEEISNFNPCSFMVPSYRLVLYKSINLLGSPWQTSPFPQIWSSIQRHSFLSYLYPLTLLTVALSNFNQSSFIEPSYRLVFYRTIDPLGSPWWTPPFPPNLVFYIVKIKDISPFRMIIYRLLSVRQVLWRVLHVYTRPNLP